MVQKGQRSVSHRAQSLSNATDVLSLFLYGYRQLADLFFFLFFIPRPHPNPLPDLFLIVSSTLLSSLIYKFHRHLLSFSSPSLSPSLLWSPLLPSHYITSHPSYLPHHRHLQPQSCLVRYQPFYFHQVAPGEYNNTVEQSKNEYEMRQEKIFTQIFYAILIQTYFSLLWSQIRTS